jgi:hypothetical protein
MRFEDNFNQVRGLLTIIKKYNDGREELVLQDHNMIVSGMGVALSEMFSAPDDASVDNFQIDRFQLGISGPPATGVTSSIFQLAGALQSINDYGTQTNLEIEENEQIVNTGYKIVPTAKIPKGKINKIGNNKVRYTLVIDEEACNSLVVDGNKAAINEIGMLVKNPTLSEEPRPILVCYKNFSPIIKTRDFSIIFRWTIVTSEVEATPPNPFYLLLNVVEESGEFILDSGSTFAPLMSQNNNLIEDYGTYGGIFKSGSTITTAGRTIIGTGDLLQEKFQILVPSSYINFSTQDLPLMVAFADFGIDAKFSTTFSSLAEQLNARDSFGVIPFGVTRGNLASSMLYSINSREAINHIKVIVNYIINTYSVNKDRIYFYGFGTGGGHAMSIGGSLHDNRPTAWYPAAMVVHDGILSNRFTWWYNAPSHLTSASGTYPTPPNSEMLLPAKALAFWHVSSYGPDGGRYVGTFALRTLDYAPKELTRDGYDGPIWSQASAFTPDDKPYLYMETSPIEFDLNLSGDLWLSSCLLLNTTHIPAYVQFNTNNPIGPPVTLPNLMLSSFLSGTTEESLADYDIAWYNKQYSGMFVDWEIHTSSTGTHDVSTINLDEALDFCFNKQRKEVSGGITMVTRTGYYWGLSTNGYVQKSYDGKIGYKSEGIPALMAQEFAAIGLDPNLSVYPSGLSVMYWNKNINENSLTLSCTMMCQDDAQSYLNMSIEPVEIGLQHGTPSNPLVIKKLYMQTDRDATGITSSFTFANDYEYPHPWLDTHADVRMFGVRKLSYFTLKGYSNAKIIGWASAIADLSSTTINGYYRRGTYSVPHPDTLDPITGKVPANFGTISPIIYNSSGDPATDQYARISRTNKDGAPFRATTAWRYLPDWAVGDGNPTNYLLLAKVDAAKGTLILTQRGMYIISLS